MDENLSHDWISAYADGELSAEERVRVEERLRESPEAMQELFEIRALSSLLGEAVVVEVPPDFSVQVMKQAERESLIGKPAAERSGASHRSRRWLPAVTVCSTAACLAVVLFLIIPAMNQRPSTNLESTVASGTAASAPLEESESRAPDAEKFAEADFAKVDRFGLTTSEGSSIPSFSAPEIESMGKPQGGSLSAISPMNLKETAEIGDIVRVLKMSAGHVAIVELTVVDRQEGIDHLQFILSGLSIKDDPSVPRTKFDDTEAKAELYTVFVEAAPSQMQAVLTRMQRDMEFATVEVSTTISADDLEPYFASNGYATLGVNRGKRFYQKALDQTQAAEIRGEVPPKQNSKVGKKPEADSVVAKAPQTAKDEKNASESSLDAPRDQSEYQSARFRYSRQAIVRLPEKETFELIEQNKLQREVAPIADARRENIGLNLKKASQPEPSVPAPQPAELPSTQPTESAETFISEEFPVQVLFVVRLENSDAPLPAPKPSPR